MPIPVRTQQRYDARKKFKLGDRLVRKATGDIYIMGYMRNVRECWVMQLNPGRKGLVTWGVLLKEFELAGF